MDISVIIINYNTADIISQCIDAVLSQININLEIIVVDNNSQDNSVNILQKYGDKIKLIANKNNLGFGKANNQGFKLSSGKYIFLLNPDAVLSQKEDLSKLLNIMENNKNYGVLGPRVIQNHKTAEPQKIYPGQKYLKNSLKYIEKLPGNIAWIIGASMLIRRESYEKINGFDEDYFLYGEEADFCLRVRKAGWEIGYAPEIIINHIGGASERKTGIYDYWLRKQAGLILFYKKTYEVSEVIYLINKDIKRAKLKLFWLKFFRNKNKQARYQAVLDVCFQEIKRN